MRRLNVAAGLLMALAAPAALSVAPAPSDALGGTRRSCGTIVADRWHTSGKSGTTWVVTAAKTTSCTLAKRDASKLTHETVSKIGQISPAPSGFGCGGTPLGAAPVQFSCAQTSGSGGFTARASGYRV